MIKNLPFVFSNFAMTADGKIAFANHSFVPFGSKHDRERMMELRAAADAIICGAGTIKETNAVLGTGGKKFERLRLKNGLAKELLRIIVSGEGSISPKAKIFRSGSSPVIVLATARIPKKRLNRLRAVAEVKIFGRQKINLFAALCWLRQKRNVKRLLCEGGGELHGALIRANLVAELHLTICPKIFGGKNAPTIADENGFLRLNEATQLRLKSIRRIGDELFLVFAVRK